MTEKHLKKCSTFLAIREIQIKTTLRFHLTPVKMVKIKTTVTAYAGENVEQGEHSFTDCRSENLYSHFDINMTVSKRTVSLSTSRPSHNTMNIYSKDALSYHKSNCLAKFIAALSIIAQM
jgi:phage gp16-like protein